MYIYMYIYIYIDIYRYIYIRCIFYQSSCRKCIYGGPSFEVASEILACDPAAKQVGCENIRDQSKAFASF